MNLKDVNGWEQTERPSGSSPPFLEERKAGAPDWSLPPPGRNSWGKALSKTNARHMLNMIALIKTLPSVIAGKYSVKKQDVKLCTHYAAVYAFCCYCFPRKGVG